jgi:hypothetical protein
MYIYKQHIYICTNICIYRAPSDNSRTAIMNLLRSTPARPAYYSIVSVMLGQGMIILMYLFFIYINM